jgi:ubiquinone/menaquinone biosynthesis C-methylase UbiE
MDRFYEQANSLFVEAYDALYAEAPPPITGDVAFYESMARQSSGAVLEVACGTGRVLLALAEAGLEIVGIDCSEGMLAIARRKLAGRPALVQDRVTLVNQDMSELNLGRRFAFIFVAFRSFQHLLTIDLQKKCLNAIRGHLEKDGRLALHLFDPRLELLVDDAPLIAKLASTHPASGRRYVGEILRTRLDRLTQVRRDLWRYTEMGAEGEILAQDTREMALRWTYRWELHHLLESRGFAVAAEYSDFVGSPPAYGAELIMLARAK